MHCLISCALQCPRLGAGGKGTANDHFQASSAEPRVCEEGREGVGDACCMLACVQHRWQPQVLPLHLITPLSLLQSCLFIPLPPPAHLPAHLQAAVP